MIAESFHARDDVGRGSAAPDEALSPPSASSAPPQPADNSTPLGMDTSNASPPPTSVAEDLSAVKRSIDSNTSILQALLARIAQLEAMVSTLAPAHSANPIPAPQTRDPPPHATWADRVKASANNHPHRSTSATTGSAPPPPATTLSASHTVAPALTFKTLLINGKHLNMLRDVAAPAEPKTVDLRSFNHRLTARGKLPLAPGHPTPPSVRTSRGQLLTLISKAPLASPPRSS
jgi:hypothetical protein